MDPEIQARLESEAQRAVTTFLDAEKTYQHCLDEMRADLPEGFEALDAAMDDRNAAVVEAREAVRKARGKFGSFKASPRVKTTFDVDGFVKLAKKLGHYQELSDSGIIATTVNMTALKKHMDPSDLVKYQEADTFQVIETSVPVYGPNVIDMIGQKK